MGLTKLYLHVREGNLRAIRCYKAAGFQEIDRCVKAGGISAITMMKIITEPESKEKMKAVCISVSNILKSGQNSMSYHLCEMISGVLVEYRNFIAGKKRDTGDGHFSGTGI